MFSLSSCPPVGQFGHVTCYAGNIGMSLQKGEGVVDMAWERQGRSKEIPICCFEQLF